MTDPIADFLTRIRNAANAGHKVVEVPGSKMKLAPTTKPDGIPTTINYSVDDPSVISITADGTITPLKSTSNSIYEIDVKHGELTNTLKFKVETGNIIDLQSIVLIIRYNTNIGCTRINSCDFTRIIDCCNTWIIT